MRELRLCPTSAGAIRAVKRHAVRLDLDTSHFTGQRRWSDAQLRRAVARSYSWRELLAELGLAGRNADERTRVKVHAMRRGLDLSHLQEPKAAGTAVVLTPDVKWLRDAGAAIAATWFLIRGCNASIPICWSPCRRELSEFRLRPRLIVRTAGKFKWAGGLIRRGTEAHYFPTTPTRWFFFFIIDGDLTMYLSHTQSGSRRARADPLAHLLPVHRR